MVLADSNSVLVAHGLVEAAAAAAACLIYIFFLESVVCSLPFENEMKPNTKPIYFKNYESRKKSYDCNMPR